jgi:hypothetical protein
VAAVDAVAREAERTAVDLERRLRMAELAAKEVREESAKRTTHIIEEVQAAVQEEAWLRLICMYSTQTRSKRYWRRLNKSMNTSQQPRLL